MEKTNYRLKEIQFSMVCKDCGELLNVEEEYNPNFKKGVFLKISLCKCCGRQIQENLNELKEIEMSLDELIKFHKEENIISGKMTELDLFKKIAKLSSRLIKSLGEITYSK